MEEQNHPEKGIRPSTWPANLLQSIARYCVQTGNGLRFGYNIPWRRSPDGKNNSRLQNIFIAQDAQLGTSVGPFGMDDLAEEGSDLAGVNAEFTFREITNSSQACENIKKEIDSQSFNAQYYQPHTPQSISLDGNEITLDRYAAKYLMLPIKDRLRHGHHFTFKAQHLALTFVAEAVTGSSVCKSTPYS
uniref:Uncharacterized protein n=1 Tax=Glossina austeni TaxID=7395 RepID=A0A1A9VIP9_GLOAU